VTHNAVDDEILKQWIRRLSQALQIVDLEVDNDLVLTVADEAAHAVNPMAAPITTFMVGYAAGLAAANPTMPSRTAVARAVDVVTAVCRQPEKEHPDATGWVNTAQ
jgi:Na+-transporting NADH:ubiquinone oxidoreductase subunit NqrD